MRLRRALAPAAVLLILAACHPTAPGPYPEVRGTYSSPTMWKTVFTYTDGTVLNGADCAGSITVERQDDNVLQGSFVVGARCLDEHGLMTGEVDRAGHVTMDLRSDGAYQTMLGCTFVAGDRSWSGQFTADTLSVRIEATLDCVPDRRVRVVRTGKGPLYPGTR
jgi:hypothetical protein